MKSTFKISEVVQEDKLIRNKSMFNVFKHMLTRKKVSRNPIKNFFMLIYLLLYRVSLETGICVMTNTEAVIVSVLFFTVVFSAINQGSRYVFLLIKKIFVVAKDVAWVYYHLDELKSHLDKSRGH